MISTGGGERPAADAAGGFGGALYRNTWGRAFPVVYDGLLALAERRGLRALRAELVGRAAGSVLEVGAGTGLNLAHYGPAVTALTLTEPETGMAARLRARVVADAPGAVVVEAGAGALPFPDHHFDHVVATLVLCTVPEPVRALEEISRVLRPEGSLLFAEHVRAPSARLAAWQDRLHNPWWWFGGGCHCNRDTLSAIAGSALEVTWSRPVRLRGLGPLVSPVIVGSACHPAPEHPPATGP